MPVDIRPARASDVDALMAIEHAVFAADRISRQGFGRMIRSASAMILVAAQGREIGGYAAVLFRRGSARARLYSLAARGPGGVGRLLLAASERAAGLRGCRAMRLEVREDNQRAISLYERSGYTLFGRAPGYYADGVAALRFEKVLEAPAVNLGHPSLPGTLDA